MILFCEFNPKLVEEFVLEGFKINNVNEVKEISLYPSGQGISSLLFLKHLGGNGELIGFFGLNIGNKILEILKKKNVIVHSIKIKDSNAEKILLKDKNQKTYIETKNPRITLEYENEFISLFSKLIDKSEIVCFSEDNISNDLNNSLIRICKNNRKIAMIMKSTSILEYMPYLLIADLEILSKYVGEKLNIYKDISKNTKEFFDKGLKVLIINMGKFVLALTKNEIFKLNFEKTPIKTINNDFIMSGFALGEDRKYNLETNLKLGFASGIIENLYSMDEISMANIKGIMNDIKLMKK